PDVDLAAAREADFEGVAVGDAVVDQVGRAAGEDLLRALRDVRLDAAAGDRADIAAAFRDDVLRARLAGRGAGRAGGGGHCGLLAVRAGRFDRVEDRALHVEVQPTAATASAGCA